MKRILGAAGLVLAGFAAGLVWLAPANKLLGLALPEGPEVPQFRGVEGRLLAGRAAQVQAGKVQVEDVSWWLSPWALPLGRVDAELALQLAPEVPARGHVQLRPDGKLRLDDWRARLSIEALKPVLNIPFLPVAGVAALHLDQARVSAEGQAEALDGTLTLRGLRWTLLKPEAPLGDYRIDIATQEDGRIVGTVQEQPGAALQARGDLTLFPDGRYALNVRITPTEQTPPPIRNSLPTMGRPDSDGAYALRYSGRLPRP